jgi:hypothetical protein
MKMLTVRLSEKLMAEIKRESRSCKIAVSEVVRERLQQASEFKQAKSSGALDLVKDLIGSVEGLPADLCLNKKRYLSSMGYGENRPSRRRVSRRAVKSQ